MNVEVACPQCKAQYAVRRELLGRRSKCVKCGTAFTLTEAPAAIAPVVKVEQPPVIEPSSAIEPSLPDFAPFPQIEVAPPVTRAKPTPPIPPPSPIPSAKPAPSFWALRWMARSYEVFALLSLIGLLVPITLLIYTVVNNPTLATLARQLYGLAIIWQIVCAAIFLLVAQLIRLILQVEQNTRETSAACRQLAEHLCGVEEAD